MIYLLLFMKRNAKKNVLNLKYLSLVNISLHQFIFLKTRTLLHAVFNVINAIILYDSEITVVH